MLGEFEDWKRVRMGWGWVGCVGWHKVGLGTMCVAWVGQDGCEMVLAMGQPVQRGAYWAKTQTTPFDVAALER